MFGFKSQTAIDSNVRREGLMSSYLANIQSVLVS